MLSNPHETATVYTLCFVIVVIFAKNVLYRVTLQEALTSCLPASPVFAACHWLVLSVGGGAGAEKTPESDITAEQTNEESYR